MIFFGPEGLRDFFFGPKRLCDFLPERLRDFFCPERLRDFSFWPEMLRDFFHQLDPLGNSENVNSNLGPVNGNLGPVNGHLGSLKKQQYTVIIGKLLFFAKNTNMLIFLLNVYYWLMSYGNIARLGKGLRALPTLQSNYSN